MSDIVGFIELTLEVNEFKKRGYDKEQQITCLEKENVRTILVIKKIMEEQCLQRKQDNYELN